MCDIFECVVIIGGGVIGCEFVYVFVVYGSVVMVVEMLFILLL